MVELLGMPPLHMIESSAKARKFFVRRGGDRPYWELRARPGNAGSNAGTPAPRGKSLDELLRVPGLIGRDAPRAEQQEGIARLIFRDLVARMLCYDAAARITPLEALHHYFFCTDEIARFILDCNTLQRPSQVPLLSVVSVLTMRRFLRFRRIRRLRRAGTRGTRRGSTRRTRCERRRGCWTAASPASRRRPCRPSRCSRAGLRSPSPTRWTWSALSTT
jgi:hypothetical protein